MVTAGEDATCRVAIFCNVCCELKDFDDMFTLTNCSHDFCKPCLLEFCRVLVDKSTYMVACPDGTCDRLVHATDVRAILSVQEDLLHRWERLQLRHALANEHDVCWCPAAGCTFATIKPKRSRLGRMSASQADRQITCEVPTCRTVFCRRCGVEWSQHADGGRGKRCPGTGGKKSHRLGMNVRRCPSCHLPAVKEGGCNFVKCPLCACQFCWFCGQRTDNACFLHWAAFCSLRTDRITRKIKTCTKEVLWKRLLIALSLLIFALTLLPVLVTCTVLFLLPCQLWRDWYFVTPGGACRRILLLTFLFILFYPLFLVLSPIVWLLLLVDCLYDSSVAVSVMLCPSPTRRRREFDEDVDSMTAVAV